MRVYLNTGMEGREIPIHDFYLELISHPPVDYVHPEKSRGGQDSVNSMSRLEYYYWKVTHRMANYLRIPKANYIPYRDVDLVHSCRHYLVLNRIPWVVQLDEHIGFFSSVPGTLRMIKNRTWRRVLEKFLASKYCKKIMPSSNGARKTIEEYLDTSNFEDKIEVVYPAHSLMEMSQKGEDNDKIKLLFIGKNFYAKGGKETLKSFERLKKKYENVELTMVCRDIPRDIKEKYKNFENLALLSNISNKKINNLYRQSDIFIAPIYVDSLGIYLEAMAYGLPMVTSNASLHYDFVEDGKTGFIIDAPVSWEARGRFSKIWYDWSEFESFLKNTHRPEVVENLVDKISILIENESLRNKMSENTRKKIEIGELSIRERNKKLKRIYEEAVQR